jgi:hypothetical protein
MLGTWTEMDSHVRSVAACCSALSDRPNSNFMTMRCILKTLDVTITMTAADITGGFA